MVLFRQKPFWMVLFRQKPFWMVFSPETVPTGFRHLPAGRRFALHPE
jgi:hypothetical protein